ncbi:MAG: proprotein convertase P-domain-containing protein [Verrucomicrobiota bacterium]|jgi:hypothetical protein
MKKKLFLVAIFATLSAGNAWSNSVTAGATPGLQITDYAHGGVARTVTLNSTGISSISDVQVTLDVTGDPSAFNGDYYAYLTHDSDIAILLNRVGVTDSSNPNDFGYADNGFDITLSDGSYNVHNYLNTAYTLNANGQLTGTWGPDGRNVSPFSVTDAASQTGLLNAFNGQDADGAWTLFIADASPGGVGELANWSLTVDGQTTSSVPDSGNTLALLVSACVGVFACRTGRIWRSSLRRYL